MFLYASENLHHKKMEFVQIMTILVVMPDHFHAIIQIDNGRVVGISVGGGLKPSPTDTQPPEPGMQPTKHGNLCNCQLHK